MYDLKSKDPEIKCAWKNNMWVKNGRVEEGGPMFPYFKTFFPSCTEVSPPPKQTKVFYRIPEIPRTQRRHNRKGSTPCYISSAPNSLLKGPLQRIQLTLLTNSRV
jgi:hypothetical protein